jgi:DNA (cytosine-5)-methyltransferase 1
VRPSLARLAGTLRTPTTAYTRASANATATPAASIREPAGRTLTGATRLLPTPKVSDARGPGGHGAGGPDLRTTVAFLPTPRGSDGAKGSPAQRGSHGDLTLPAAAVAVGTHHPPAGASGTPDEHSRAGRESTTRWGPFAEAVAGWQQILGRPSPAPTQPGRHGRPVLAPRWVEWLMGLPDGWVTGVDLPRTVALRLLGNGVVPHQAVAALRALLLVHARPEAGRR